ncbi:GCN5 family acetyltransferase [Hydrocoleum sp. CS-953]|uniref:GNAT family N-acetyltransferase n=1 Tax=Hydrocoleum sp. CS-953 TaxID=1671698 RepID=UPI000B9BCAE3|nr:GNAT family N-acetyltransferase [Hydrocoleum sp. CS-953]OZH53899.1 GCN5 family acetyltransferase [Hydrocoleum sp. CS-953]
MNETNIRLLQEHELPKADRIFRLAFGTFLGLPDPMKFSGNTNYMQRWYAYPKAAFAAEIDGQLVGSNFLSKWGSFGSFGPLSVHPNFWNQRVGEKLMLATMECFQNWQTQQICFFTFSRSPKHLYFYQKFGFMPHFLTAICAKYVSQKQQQLQSIRYSQISPEKQKEYLSASQELTNNIYPGLDLQSEILAVANQRLGDTLFLWENGNLEGFAICHYGADTEAGSNTCYIKFGAVNLGKKGSDITPFHSQERFAKLLNECEIFSHIVGMSKLVVGVNTSRQQAYIQILNMGFKIETLGVAMHNPNEPGYNRPDIYIIDDYR